METKNLLSHIGNTPLVELCKINPNPNVRIFAKLEFMNPSSSIKDRIVAHIIKSAEEEGLLQKGGTIVENTSGNTGAAIAMIGALKGYKVILTMPDKVSKEKQNALKAYGAKIVVCPTSAPHGREDHYVCVAKKIAEETPNSYWINQYDNPLNPEAHYKGTGPEIWQQTNGELDYFVASGSTGGSISGTGKYLKEQNPEIKTVLADPVGSIYHHYFKTGTLPDEEVGCTYQVEGVGEDHITDAINFDVIDDVYQFTDQEAFMMARKLAKEEGILAGGSSGANVWASVKLAKSLDKPATIVTLLPDSGIKYLSKIYNDEWMTDMGLLAASSREAAGLNDSNKLAQKKAIR